MSGHKREGRRHWGTWGGRAAALIAVAAAAMGAMQLAAPDQASAVAGLQRVSATSRFNNDPAKKAVAWCPEWKVVIGGGAVVNDGGRRLVRLTVLAPDIFLSQNRGFWVAEAEAPDLDRGYEWSVTAYAICASELLLDDYRINRALTYNGASATFSHVEARCDGNDVAYGAGALVASGSSGSAPTGQLGLQLVRTSGPLDVARATARESAAGYDGPWRLQSFAICADRRVKQYSGGLWLDSGVHARGSASHPDGAGTTDRCPTGYRTHGPGGGGAPWDSGPSWLTDIEPHADLRGVTTRMTGPLNPSIGGMTAHQTCALY
jgi:hypothetical protein